MLPEGLEPSLHDYKSRVLTFELQKQNDRVIHLLLSLQVLGLPALPRLLLQSMAVGTGQVTVFHAHTLFIFCFWQTGKDSNSHLTGLEPVVFPIKLPAYIFL